MRPQLVLFKKDVAKELRFADGVIVPGKERKCANKIVEVVSIHR